MFSKITNRKLKALFFYIASWIVGCLAFISLYYYGVPNVLDQAFYLYIFQFSIFTGLSQGIYDVLILQDDKDHRHIVAALIIRSLYLALTVILNVGLCVLVGSLYSEGRLITENSLAQLGVHFSLPSTKVFILYAFILGYLINFVRSVHKKFGTRVFINTLLGKYQTPIEEDRVFMFIDLRRSTELAETLGHMVYSQFLSDYYHYVSNCCEENQGEIYQIVGDGVYITWPMRKCRKKPRPVICFFDLKHTLENLAPNFRNKYGVVPSFKAAVHGGVVVVNEVGNFGSEMAYHGDVLNTTARLQSLCSKIQQEFLISEELLHKLHGLEIYSPTVEGRFDLKGKSTCVVAYSLKKPFTTKDSLEQIS